MAGKINLQKSLQKPYERRLFITDVLNPVFQNRMEVFASPINETANLSDGETKLIKTVLRYGNITLDDETNITCYEITLHNAVRLEQNKISIQHYVRKLIIAGEAMLVNFITDNAIWRFSLVASDTKMMDTGEIKDLKTNAKRYTYLLGKTETCLTAATQLAILEGKPNIERKDLVDAFSVEKVSKPFFDEYTKIHYKRFNDFLINSNFKISVFNGDEKAIRDFVKKLLGRIVFLYFVQKKGWLGNNPDFMMSLFKTSGGNDAFYPLWLSKLFFDTLNAPRKDDTFEMPDKTLVKIPFLNGGLFEKDKHDESILTFPPLMFHNPENPDTDKDRGFLDFLNAYNFTVYEDSPDDHTVAVDPEMLGHIFENLLEDNKDKGAFYTPKEIVHYMCQESLIEYLTQKEAFAQSENFLRTDIENLIKNQEVSTDLSKQYLTYLNARLDAVRICDPAIGSGAFPMGLLHEIFNAKVLIMNALNGISPTPAERVEIKLHIIQNSIYGVDIEKGAVDIARLRFWLSLIVDEQTPKALPNLDYKIVVGNSLVSKFEDEVISIDWEVKEGTQTGMFGNSNVERRRDLLREISKKQHYFFIPENHDKKAISLKIKNLKIDLLINQLELMIKDKHQTDEPKVTSYKTKALFMKAQELYFQTLGWQQNIQKLKRIKENPTATLHFFDWKLDFPEVLNPTLVGNNGGFDIVIGNPPYVGISKLQDKNILEKANFQTFESNGDIYSLFYEMGNNLLKMKGNLCFITSRQWINAGYGKSTRKYFAEQTNPLLLIDFGKAKLFETATVFVNILMFEKAKNQHQLKACLFPDDFKVEKTDVGTYFNQKNIQLKNISDNVWKIGEDNVELINQKIEQKGVKLKDWKDIEFFRGVTTGLNEAFHIDEITKNELIAKDPKSAEIIKPLLRGKDIKRYGYKFEKKHLIFANQNIEINKYPEIKNHLRQFYDDLKPKINEFDKIGRKSGRYEWYEIQDNTAYFPKFITPKIVWIEISDRANFTYDTEGMYLTNSAYFMSGIGLKYILAVLNSRVSDFYFSQITAKIAGGRMRYTKQYVEQIPIPQTIPEAQKPFELLVNQILTKKKAGEDTSELEAEIDRLVYGLYDLTAAEIGVIEGR
jgi:adenine-specific DNA-methyltransferase